MFLFIKSLHYFFFSLFAFFSFSFYFKFFLCYFVLSIQGTHLNFIFYI
ncbi:sensor histidine kinase, partial [Clostridioides difficile]